MIVSCSLFGFKKKPVVVVDPDPENPDPENPDPENPPPVSTIEAWFVASSFGGSTSIPRAYAKSTTEKQAIFKDKAVYLSTSEMIGHTGFDKNGDPSGSDGSKISTIRILNALEKDPITTSTNTNPNEGLNFTGPILMDLETPEVYTVLKESDPGQPDFEAACDQWIAGAKVIFEKYPKAAIGVYGLPFSAFNTGINSKANGVGTGETDAINQTRFNRILGCGYITAVFTNMYIPYAQLDSGVRPNTQNWRTKDSIHTSITRTVTNPLVYANRYNLRVYMLSWEKIHTEAAEETAQLIAPHMLESHFRKALSVEVNGRKIDGFLMWNPLGFDSRAVVSVGGSAPNVLPYVAPPQLRLRGLRAYINNVLTNWLGKSMEIPMSTDTNGNPVYPDTGDRIQYESYQRDTLIAMYNAITNKHDQYLWGYNPLQKLQSTEANTAIIP